MIMSLTVVLLHTDSIPMEVSVLSKLRMLSTLIFIHGFYYFFFQSNCYYRFVFLFILRTKTLVLELLTVVCLITGGHERVLNAFDNFKKEPSYINYHRKLTTFSFMELWMVLTDGNTKYTYYVNHSFYKYRVYV
ncbi:unnamed protein product [Schistosoma margrebowiei]|uniref:Uncharacterized protein n=1 Tax=Schistosoma margrebowiei TaxID=48269 RepID=A0A183N0W4_9TREM|nr:unnamed protein product [Schistosoma margrebowiei]